MPTPSSFRVFCVFCVLCDSDKCPPPLPSVFFCVFCVLCDSDKGHVGHRVAHSDLRVTCKNCRFPHNFCVFTDTPIGHHKAKPNNSAGSPYWQGNCLPMTNLLARKGKVMGILTNDPFLITWATSLGFVSFLLRFIATGMNVYICDIGMCIGMWGIVSAVINRWKQVRPHHNIRKYELLANVIVLFITPCLLILRYVFSGFG